jgi:uncharacterized OB-fold protein
VSFRLAPSMTADTQFFWDGAKRGRLLIQRCGACAALRHPPRPMCPHCHSLEWDVIEASGRGTVYSFVMPRHPPLPFFEDGYIVVLVALEEGVRIVSNLVDVEPDDASIGLPVRVRFDSFDGDVVLPVFVAEDSA